MENLAKLGINPGEILVYLVNFGLLWAAMAYFVFPKIIRMIDERRSQIESNLTTAERIQEELDETLAQARKEKEALATKVATELAAAEKDIAKQRSEMLQELDTKRSEMLDEARAMIKQERAQIVSGAESQTLGLIQRVLIRVLGENVHPDDVAASVKAVWEETKQEVSK